MEAQVIDKIRDLVDEAQPIQRAPDYAETGRYYLRLPDGQWSIQYSDGVARRASLNGTGSFARLLLEERSAGVEVEVYYDTDLLRAVLGKDRLVWEHEMLLPLHPVFAHLQGMLQTRSLDQRNLIRLLRAQLNGHVDDAIIERFRTLRLSTDGSGESVVSQGRAAVDKRIQRQVQDERGETIPDEITVSVPVYDLDEVRGDMKPVTVLVDCVPGEDGRPVFELTTVLNSLREAQRRALAQVVENLHELLPDEVATYHGRARRSALSPSPSASSPSVSGARRG